VSFSAAGWQYEIQLEDWSKEPREFKRLMADREDIERLIKFLRELLKCSSSNS